MIEISNATCNKIYDILDTMPLTDYVPIKHEVNKLKKDDDNECKAAFLIYCADYNTEETKALKKLLTTELSVQ